jgi:hypothetical protein
MVDCGNLGCFLLHDEFFLVFPYIVIPTSIHIGQLPGVMINIVIVIIPVISMIISF